MAPCSGSFPSSASSGRDRSARQPSRGAWSPRRRNLSRRSIWETLAGRIAYHELPPFRANETGAGAIDRLWVRGGFPPSFLAPDEKASVRWRQAFVRTFLERGLPQLGVSVPAATMRRFWTMVAHYHGNRWNSAEIGRALGASGPTVNAYLDHLVDALVVRRLAPWHENLRT